MIELLRYVPTSDEVWVPQIVFDEVMQGELSDPNTALVIQAANDWLRIVPTPPQSSQINSLRIDAGEIGVLSLALLNQSVTVVLDDLAARMEADRLGINKTGTLRVLLDAKRIGIISSVRNPLELLRNHGMRLSPAIWREVLDQAGE